MFRKKSFSRNNYDFLFSSFSIFKIILGTVIKFFFLSIYTHGEFRTVFGKNDVHGRTVHVHIL